jgi:predicted O-methyltransferase YrrM
MMSLAYRAVTVDTPLDDRALRALRQALIALGALTVSLSEGPCGARLEADFEAGARGLRGSIVRAARRLGVDTLHIQVGPRGSMRAPVLWRRSQRAQRVGPLLFVEPGAPAGEGRVVRIEPGMAFGTVSHATTMMCLEWLVDHVPGPYRTLLDVGTGTGILALSALVLGVERAVMLDVDEESCALARENVRLNGLSSRAEVHRGALEQLTGQFPLVLGNILTEPLVDLAPSLVARAAPEGAIVLSGVRDGEQAEIASAYAALGWAVRRVRAREGWLMLELRQGERGGAVGSST